VFEQVHRQPKAGGDGKGYNEVSAGEVKKESKPKRRPTRIFEGGAKRMKGELGQCNLHMGRTKGANVLYFRRENLEGGRKTMKIATSRPGGRSGERAGAPFKGKQGVRGHVHENVKKEEQFPRWGSHLSRKRKERKK